MKIVKLTVENLMRLKAVEITPQDDVVIIGGDNGQGKTSVLNALWFAIGGAKSFSDTTKPIREGENSASVEVDLGEIIVTRSWSEDGKTALRVSSPDGARYSSPQDKLNALYGALTFDPLDFIRKPNRDQRQALLDLVDLPFDLDEHEKERQAAYDKRTEIGREVKGLNAQVSSSVKHETDPGWNLDVEDIAQRMMHSVTVSGKITQALQDSEFLESRIVRLRDELSEVEGLLEGLIEFLSSAENPEPLEDIKAEQALISERLALIEDNERHDILVASLSQWEERYEELTEEIGMLDVDKADALSKAKMPIDGIGISEGAVTFNGIPLSQASSAEQLRVSTAIAMAANPELRVIRVQDGSLLDDNSMNILREMARENDFQVWIEKVHVGDDEGAFIIVEGEVSDSTSKVKETKAQKKAKSDALLNTNFDS